MTLNICLGHICSFSLQVGVWVIEKFTPSVKSPHFRCVCYVMWFLPCGTLWTSCLHANDAEPNAKLVNCTFICSSNDIWWGFYRNLNTAVQKLHNLCHCLGKIFTVPNIFMGSWGPRVSLILMGFPHDDGCQRDFASVLPHIYILGKQDMIKVPGEQIKQIKNI